MILVISSKSAYAAKRLLEEARLRNLEPVSRGVRIGSNIKSRRASRSGLIIMDMRRLVACNFKLDVNRYATLYIRNPYLNGSPKYLPQIIKLASRFRQADKKVVDANIADGNIGRGKWADSKALLKAGLPIPNICIVHGRELYKDKFPFILKWIYGFKARNVFLVRNERQLRELLPLHPKKEWLAQEFIKADYEYKIITVGYKALPVVLRFGINPDGFRVDFEKFKTVKSSSIPDIIRAAEKASSALGRELAKVDILQKGNRLYILEVNRFPGLDSFEQLAKYNVVKHFLKYLQK